MGERGRFWEVREKVLAGARQFFGRCAAVFLEGGVLKSAAGLGILCSYERKFKKALAYIPEGML